MTRPALNPDEDDAIQAAAAEWVVREERGLSAAEQDIFLQWLARDPRHAHWIAYHRRTWREFDRLSEWRPEHSVDPNSDLLARTPRQRAWWRRRAFVPVAVAASVAVLAGWFALDGGRDFAPSPASELNWAASTYERRVLADGSTLELNAGAAVDVRFGANERRVTLLRGEALFTVSPDPARPFVVRAGGAELQALGTAFNVRLAADSLAVLVTHGRVAVSPPPRTADTMPRTSGPVLGVGQRARVSLDGEAPVEIATLSTDEIARELAWQPRLLEFSSAPLAEVVVAFNRHNRVQIVIADPALREMPVVATLRSDQVEVLLRVLAPAGVRAERSGDVIVLRR